MKKLTVLVLGSTGMVGNAVYTYLAANPSLKVFGTKREQLSVKSAEKDLKEIYKTLPYIDYIINCIGEKSTDTPIQSLVLTNSWFPRILESFTEKKKTRLIHISTDAVFGKTQKNTTEKTIPIPDTLYALSKLLGETKASHALTIRTSFLGFPFKKTSGYTNQSWSGCTTLQFAKFCTEIIEKNVFNTLRKKTPIFHFVPIKPTTKYELAKKVLQLSRKHTTQEKLKGEKITRVLASDYPNSVSLRNYSITVGESLQKLYDYHKKT